MGTKKTTVTKAKKRSKRKRVGKASKGSAFERQFAKDFGEAVYNDGQALWRSHGSGGLKRSNYYTGDIVPVDNSLYFPFHIELKRGYNWDVHKLISDRVVFDKGSHDFIDFIFKAVKDNKTNKKNQPYLMIVVKKDYDDPYFLTNRRLYDRLRETSYPYGLQNVISIQCSGLKGIVFYMFPYNKLIQSFLRKIVIGGH